MKTREGNTVFCDDIRLEVGNKLSLMGIYAADIAFTTPPPITFPKLGAVVWLIFNKEDVPRRLSLRILMPPNRTELAKIEAEGPENPDFGESDDFSRNVVVRIPIPLQNVVFAEEGYMEIMVDIEGEETFRAGRLRIRFNADTEATPAA